MQISRYRPLTIGKSSSEEGVLDGSPIGNPNDIHEVTNSRFQSDTEEKEEDHSDTQVQSNQGAISGRQDYPEPDIAVAIDVFQDIAMEVADHGCIAVGTGLVRVRISDNDGKVALNSEFVLSACTLTGREGGHRFLKKDCQLALLIYQLERISVSMIPTRFYVDRGYSMHVRPCIDVTLAYSGIGSDNDEELLMLLSALKDFADKEKTEVRYRVKQQEYSHEVSGGYFEFKRDILRRVRENHLFPSTLFKELSLDNYDAMAWANSSSSALLFKNKDGEDYLLASTEYIDSFFNDKSLGQSSFMVQPGGNQFGTQSHSGFNYTHASAKTNTIMTLFVAAGIRKSETDIAIANEHYFSVLGNCVSINDDLKWMNREHYHALEWRFLTIAMIKIGAFVPVPILLRRGTKADAYLDQVQRTIRYQAKMMTSRLPKPIQSLHTYSEVHENEFNGATKRCAERTSAVNYRRLVFPLPEDEVDKTNIIGLLCERFPGTEQDLDEWYGFSGIFRTIFVAVRGKKETSYVTRRLSGVFKDDKACRRIWSLADSSNPNLTIRIVVEVLEDHIEYVVEKLLGISLPAERQSLFLEQSLQVQCRWHQVIECFGKEAQVGATGRSRTKRLLLGPEFHWINTGNRSISDEDVRGATCKCERVKIE
jgi:hypothetical protein